MSRRRAALIAWLTSPQVWLAIAALAFVYWLTGCASVFDGPRPARDRIVATIELVDDDALAPGVLADSACGAGECLIRIRRSTYPQCITHEVRHGFEPGFHRGRESDEDCYVTR